MRRRKIFFAFIPDWIKIAFLGAVAVVLFLLGAIIIWAAVMPIPAINNFENRQVAESTKIYDRTGNIVLYDVHGAVRRTSVPLEEISPLTQEATIAIEDDSFYRNAGFRPLSFLRAVFVDIMSGSYAQGGSTITQQVVKNALLSQSKTIPRKIQEIILALRLTRNYSKQQILNAYLNEVPYGGTIYGVQEASQYFFGVDAKDVDLAEAAYLAALPQAPTYYSPYGNHKKELDQRKNFVLFKMKELGYITDAQYAEAKKENVQFRSEVTAGIKAPHFVFYIREYLERKYGVDAVENGGLRVITTIDYDLQEKMEEIVTKYAASMERDFNASNEAMVTIDPKTGQILAMVGSRDYFNDEIEGKYNDALALRQPGSSFKPFVYATAFEKGYTPETIVFDLPTQFSTSCSAQDVSNNTPPCYAPQNYDGTFKGPMTMRNAIAQSENVPSVKVLYLAGIKDSLKTAADLGITTLVDASRYGLTLVLGGGEVTLLEMTGAYSVFANDGVRNAPTGVLQVSNRSAAVLEQYSGKPTRVVDAQIARQMSAILSDDAARAPEFGVHSPLYFAEADVADKTGTTNDSRDAWIIGYTPSIAVGAWAGNNDNTPMVKKIAAFIVAPMWHEFVEYAIEKYPSDSFPPPSPESQIESLPPVLRGNWNTDPSRGVHDVLYWVQRDNPRAGPPSNPWADSQMPYWDYPVQLWASAGGALPTTVQPASDGVPNNVSNPDPYAITSPARGSVVSAATPFVVTVAAPDLGRIRTVQYVLNGAPVATAHTSPFTASITPHTPGPATLQAIFLLSDGSVQAFTSFTIQ